MPRTVRIRLVAVALVGCAALAGCAQVPHSGAVKIGPRLTGTSGLPDTLIHEVPPGPVPNETPTELINGFLRAMIDSDSNYSAVRSFLTGGASWSAGQTITTYEPSSVQISRVGATVTMRAQRVGVISARGSFSLAPAAITRRFSVTREDGQWRISRLANGVLLSTDDAQKSLQSANVYFLNSTEDRLVPDPLLVAPQQPGLATTLIDDLVAGPSSALSPAVHTAVPRGVTLAGNVPITPNGVAEVDFSSAARQMSSGDLIRLSAQVVWTLKQLASVTAVQMLVNGTPLAAPNVASLQSVRAWGQFDPAAPPSARGALLTRSGVVAGLGTDAPNGLDGVTLSAPAQSADGSVVAGLRPSGGGTSLLIGPGGGPLAVRATALTMSAPTFDPQGDVFVAQGGPGGERIVEYPTHGSPLQVATSGLLRDEVQAIALSRDGSRIAAVVGPIGAGELVVGTISSLRTRPAVNDVHLVLPPGRDVEGVAWASADQLVCTFAQPGGHRGVLEVSIDGYQAVPLGGVGLTPAPNQVAAAPGRRILAAGAGGIWTLSGREWERVASGSDPSYPG